MLATTRKILFLIAGLIAIALAILGIVLPVLPATPWAILAAFCFAKANPKWEKKLLEHPQLGPLIINWRERQAIPRLAKWAALIMMLVSTITCWFQLPSLWAMVLTGTLLIVAIWIWTRPDQ
jgi:uncharacterized membrane protein YbaN (DUF454 family)